MASARPPKELLAMAFAKAGRKLHVPADPESCTGSWPEPTTAPTAYGDTKPTSCAPGMKSTQTSVTWRWNCPRVPVRPWWAG